MFPGERVRAADNQVAVPEVGTSKVQNETYSTGIETAVSDYLAPTIKGEYFKMAFTNVDADTFLFIGASLPERANGLVSCIRARHRRLSVLWVSGPGCSPDQ